MTWRLRRCWGFSVSTVVRRSSEVRHGARNQKSSTHQDRFLKRRRSDKCLRMEPGGAVVMIHHACGVPHSATSVREFVTLRPCMPKCLHHPLHHLLLISCRDGRHDRLFPQHQHQHRISQSHRVQVCCLDCSVVEWLAAVAVNSLMCLALRCSTCLGLDGCMNV